MRITHCLRDSKARKPTPVHTFVHWTIDGQHFQWKLSTGLKVEPRLWDSRRKRAKRGAVYETILNSKLAETETIMQRLFAELEALGILPTPATVRERYAALKAPRRKHVEFFPAYERFIDSRKGRLQKSSITVHRTALNHLRAFAKAYNISMEFNALTLPLFDKFLHYLIQIAGLSNVSAWKVLARVRVFLKYAVEHGLSTNKDYERFTRKRLPTGEKSEKVYITLPELRKLQALDLQNDRRLEVTRDLFLFQAHTGLRYSDVQRIGEEHVHEKELRLVTAKNKKAIRVPLLPVSKTILMKYGNRLPRRSNQKQNTYLKELCRMAGIDRPVSVVSYKGVERIENIVPKYELIGTHSAKRTFVSILRQSGITVEAICRMTGNSRQSIESYILKDDEDMQAEMDKLQEAFSGGV